MTDSDRCQIPCGAGSVPRACAPFSPPPPASSVPVVAPPVLVPVAPVMPVMSVSGEVPDRFGNVDIGPYVRSVLDRALLDLDLFAPFLARIVESGTFAPASGIAKAALAVAVQESLGKADSAVQPSGLFDGGRIKSSLLPSYVDDVLEYSALSGFPGSGETGKIYVARDTNRTYRWSGSQYVEIAASPVTSVNGQTGAVTLAIPAEQVNADWNATEGKARILNKPDTFPPGSHVHGMSDVTGLVVALGGKANRSEMSVTPGTGADADKTTIRLKDGTSATVLTAHQDVSGKANASEVNAALALKADADALPYALVVPGEWTVSGLSENETIYSGPTFRNSGETYWWQLVIAEDSIQKDFVSDSWYDESHENDLSVMFQYESRHITATRASLPDHLADRAVNAVPVSTTTMLTLPPANPGHSRDLLVRLSVSATSVVTWAVAQGDSWDSAGAPPGTFAAGTYLYRFTEVAPGVFHAADITNGGSIDPAVLDGKLDASSAAPPFSDSLTYLVGEYVTYGGSLYRCKTAVAVAGEWTGASNWEYVDMTSPDATLDIRSDGRLEVVSAGGETLWIQGYDMSSASSVSLSCERVNLYAFASGTTTQAFDMPSVPGGKVGDFVLDVDNSANASDSATATLNGFGTSFDVFTPEGQNLLTDILTFEGGEKCELYFTMTAFGTSAKPAWKVVKQVVEKQEAGS